MTTDPNDNYDFLLDQIAENLRDEIPPPLPAELAQQKVTDVSRKPKRLKRLAVYSCVVAVLLLLGIFVASVLVRDGSNKPIVNHQPPQQTPDTTASSDQTTFVSIASLQPYVRIENDLDQMKLEIAELKQKALLLDAHRRANSLLATN